MTLWLAWAALLLLQNASFTWVSRARNSGSVGYHAIASIGSNGIWFLNQVVITGIIVGILGPDGLNGLFKSGDYGRILTVAGYYTLFTVVGSVSMHWLLLKYIEKGKRKVGA